MKMTKQKLKMLVEALILKEGQVEDLLSAEPDLQSAINLGIRNPSQLKWLVRMKKFEPIADMVGLIPAFEQNKQRLAVKDLDLYKNPNDLRAALETLGESEGDKRRQLKEGETDIVYNDEQWIVVMPHTMESSILWGKGTTWCTAATKTANLFYSYVGRKEENIVLFYIIRKGADSKADPNAKLSVGFVNGKPILSGKYGGVSVNALNHGLKESSLKNILGLEFDLIINAMKSYSKNIAGEHPAKKMMQKIAMSKDKSVLDKYTRGMKNEERIDFITILLQYDLSIEMLTVLASDKDKEVRKLVLQNLKTPPEIITLFAKDENEVIRVSAAQNPNISHEALTLLAKDEDDTVRIYVARNPNTDPEDLSLLAKDEDAHVRMSVSRNPNTPKETLIVLARDEDDTVREQVAFNLSTPPEILIVLASDKDKEIRRGAAYNTSTPPETLTLLARDEDRHVKMYIAGNPSAPPETIILLARDEDYTVREQVAYKDTTPLKILALLASDEYDQVRIAVAQNRNTPLEVLSSLKRDKSKTVRIFVAKHPKTAIEDLSLLARDEDEEVRKHAVQNRTYKKYLKSQKKLAERWAKLAGLLN